MELVIKESRGNGISVKRLTRDGAGVLAGALGIIGTVLSVVMFYMK